jgi:predicted RNA-binding protein associated with RNAse of E/G family
MESGLRSITICSRLGKLPGLSDGQSAMFDCFDERARRVVRHFVLLEKNVKLMYEPWTWKERWYVDLVDVQWADPQTLVLEDLWLDVIVEANGPTYRLIDLEELADALLAGATTIERMHAPLRALQRFLDEHLHGGKDFPPAALGVYRDIAPG